MPVIVSMELATGVAELVVIVSAELLDPVMDVGLNEALAPPGSPLALKLTVPAKPFRAETLTVYKALPPGLTVCELGAAEIVKSAGG